MVAEEGVEEKKGCDSEAGEDVEEGGGTVKGALAQENLVLVIAGRRRAGNCLIEKQGERGLVLENIIWESGT